MNFRDAIRSQDFFRGLVAGFITVAIISMGIYLFLLNRHKSAAGKNVSKSISSRKHITFRTGGKYPGFVYDGDSLGNLGDTFCFYIVDPNIEDNGIFYMEFMDMIRFHINYYGTYRMGRPSSCRVLAAGPASCNVMYQRIFERTLMTGEKYTETREIKAAAHSLQISKCGRLIVYMTDLDAEAPFRKSAVRFAAIRNGGKWLIGSEY